MLDDTVWNRRSMLSVVRRIFVLVSLLVCIEKCDGYINIETTPLSRRIYHTGTSGPTYPPSITTECSSTSTRWMPPSFVSHSNQQRNAVLRLHGSRKSSEEDDNNDFELNDDNNNNDDTLLFQQLRDRVNQVTEMEQKQLQRIRQANCTSSVAVVLPDWVRRIDIGQYPIVACGSASDTLFVAHLQTGEVLASSQKYNNNAAEMNENDSDDTMNEHPTMRLLYGKYDGGGTVSIAIQGNMIAEGRRSGGVKIWRWDTGSPDLLYQGSLLDDCIATSLQFDADQNLVWIGTDDGRVVAYSTESELDGMITKNEQEPSTRMLPLVLQTKAEYQWNLKSTVLSISVFPDIGYVIATTESGSVHLLSIDEYDDDNNESSIQSFAPPFDSSERRSSHSYVLCATIISHYDSSATTATTTTTEEGGGGSKISNTNKSYSIVCGGNDGSIYIQPLNMMKNCDGTRTSEINTDNPFQGTTIRQLMPSHFGPVKCIQPMNGRTGNTNSNNGLFVSAGLDGALRVWDIHARKNLYQFLGYKVWMGSVWTDGKRIVTDGADNTIILHDFTSDDDTTNRPSSSNSDGYENRSKNE